MELHGVRSWRRAREKDTEASFTVRLAQVYPARESSNTVVPLERRTRLRRVLLIEDSTDAREMLRMMLELAGHVVYDSADGPRGLVLLNTLAS